MASLIREGTHRFAVFVRGVQSHSKVTCVTFVPDFECLYLLSAECMPTYTEVAYTLYDTPTLWDDNNYLLRDCLAPQYMLFHLVFVSSIFPTSQKPKIYLWAAHIFYTIVSNKCVNFFRCWIKSIIVSIDDAKKFVFCGVIITRLCTHTGIQRGGT